MSDKKRKILHLITGLETGGAEMMLCRILPLLNDFEHVVCTLAAGGELSGRITKLGIPLYQLNGGKHFSLSSIIAFRRILKKERPDIISTRLIHADIFGRIFGRLFGVKNIICIAESLLDQSKYNKFFLIERATSFLVSHYIAVSNAVRNIYIEKAHINSKIITTINNGVFLDSFKVLPDKQIARQTFNYTTEFLIGCAAKFRPERNHVHMIKAFSILAGAYPDARMILAGDGPERTNIEQNIVALGLTDKVKLLGMRNDVPLYLKSLDVYLTLSSYEGMSVAIIEAMASGLPVVASDILPNRELIQDGVNGYLVHQDDSKQVARILSQLVKNHKLRTEMGANSLKKSLLFDINKTAAELAAIYNK